MKVEEARKLARGGRTRGGNRILLTKETLMRGSIKGVKRVYLDAKDSSKVRIIEQFDFPGGEATLRIVVLDLQEEYGKVAEISASNISLANGLKGFSVRGIYNRSGTETELNIRDDWLKSMNEARKLLWTKKLSSIQRELDNFRKQPPVTLTVLNLNLLDTVTPEIVLKESLLGR